MPGEVTVEIEGLDELIKKLRDLGQLRKVHAGIRAAAIYVKGKIAKYPRSTFANKPRGFNSVYSMTSRRALNSWYQRGYGTKWVRKDGSVKGSKTSENLGKKWTSKYNKDRFEAKVGNNASYAIFAQGPKQDGQAKHMARIGWKSIDTVAEKETKRVQEYVYEAVRRAIGA